MRRDPRVWRSARAGMLAGLLVALGGCNSNPVRVPARPAPPPPPTYRGPSFLQGTIGSLASLRGYQPVLVSGYGLVAGLNETGSIDCPPAIRGWLLNEMAKRGFGRESLGFGQLTPEQVLASRSTAVVLVQGIIPPGAPAGARFDLLVTALPQTQTTSLDGGVLYTTDLRVEGANVGRPAFGAIARARGPIFLDPATDPSSVDPAILDPALRRGTVLAGGVTTQGAPLQLITNRPSFRLTAQVANRINTRFPKSRLDRSPIAVAKNDSIIELKVIEQFRDNPQHMLDLLSHLFLNPSPDFAAARARELAAILEQPGNASHADDIAYAWQGLGRTTLPFLRGLYDHRDTHLRLAALQAGAGLQDTKTAAPLRQMATGDSRHGEQATALLGRVLAARPREQQIRADLRRLLDHDQLPIRLAAYEALAATDDPAVVRNAFADKLELARVRCDRPLIHVARSGRPRIIVFNDRKGFRRPLLFSMWNNQLMIRSGDEADQIAVYYKHPSRRGSLNQSIPDNIAYFLGMLAFAPEPDDQSEGCDLSYARMVRVLEELNRQKLLDAPLVVEAGDLPQRIARRRIAQVAPQRPETSPEEAPPVAPGPGSPPPPGSPAPRPDSGPVPGP